MISLFKKRPIYIQLWFNKVAVTNLFTGEVAHKDALVPFSNSRIVVANFDAAESIISEAITDIGYPWRNFGRGYSACIQQMEKLPDGLSETEKRTMRDVAEQVGCYEYEIIEHQSSLTIEEALAILKISLTPPSK